MGFWHNWMEKAAPGSWEHELKQMIEKNVIGKNYTHLLGYILMIILIHSFLEAKSQVIHQTITRCIFLIMHIAVILCEFKHYWIMEEYI